MEINIRAQRVGDVISQVLCTLPLTDAPELSECAAFCFLEQYRKASNNSQLETKEVELGRVHYSAPEAQTLQSIVHPATTSAWEKKKGTDIVHSLSIFRVAFAKQFQHECDSLIR
ncbi:hypothetical protein [Planctomicrobium sp. SH527]|uniref:hypothetical protein n=1 Tax=Planctomicrobium sp. SH527 TaxID=3448123 RepID=UPI003F5B03DD